MADYAPGDNVIGLFEGMIERNMLTFNPGWDQKGHPVDPFDDIRDIEKKLKDRGIVLTSEVAPGSEGPGFFALTDPDGNPILIDQHR